MLFARWTEDFDCEEETSWWYVIKDTPFDIHVLKAKRRYKINKGLKNFDVRIINANDYAKELYKITKSAYLQYPDKYRPSIEYNSFLNSIDGWKKHIVYGAFNRESGELCGYAWVDKYETYVDFACMKTDPSYEKYGINAAIVYGLVDSFNQNMDGNFYICDGSRNSVHETNFQDYLEKYFGFRKAFCRLRMKYRFPIGLIVKGLYPFRSKIKKEGRISSKIANVLFYEESVRKCKKNR